MIRLHRPPEPPVLVGVRAEQLATARDAIAARVAIAFEGYGVVKSDLFAMQHRKCCYCEKLQEQAKYRDVEHFRPKAAYWWLAWTWENLLFACIDCNREHKGEKFPLAPGSSALVPEQSPPGAEQALIIDPTDPAVDPFDEMVFRREKVQSHERWKPYGLTPRGRETIRVCGLDRPSLLTLYASHVRDVVRPKLMAFFAAHEVASGRAAVKAWNTANRGLLGPERPFRALSHDALDVLVPEPLRRRYGLELARPA